MPGLAGNVWKPKVNEAYRQITTTIGDGLWDSVQATVMAKGREIPVLLEFCRARKAPFELGFERNTMYEFPSWPRRRKGIPGRGNGWKQSLEGMNRWACRAKCWNTVGARGRGGRNAC